MTVSSAVELPRVPVGEWFDSLVNWCTDNLGWLFDGIGSAIDSSVEVLTDALTFLPPLVLTLVLALLALVVSGWKLGVFTILGFALIDSMELWEPAMDSLALVLVSAVVATVLSIPIGIAAARSDILRRPRRVRDRPGTAAARQGPGAGGAAAADGRPGESDRGA